MIPTPNCYLRKCKHYIGVDQPDGTESTERVVCSAYPEGIPLDIAQGDDPHYDVRADQNNNIIYEPDTDE